MVLEDELAKKVALKRQGLTGVASVWCRVRRPHDKRGWRYDSCGWLSTSATSEAGRR